MKTRVRRPGVRGATAALAVATAVLACSPVFDWREARPEGSGAVLMFPCRPAQHRRTVRLSTAMVPMQLHSCRSGGATFALGVVEVAEPADVTPFLAALRASVLANLAGTAGEQDASSPAGATPNPQSGRIAVVGTGQDGRHVVARAAFFVKGLRLYQATVLDADDARGREAVDTFFGSIRLS